MIFPALEGYLVSPNKSKQPLTMPHNHRAMKKRMIDLFITLQTKVFKGVCEARLEARTEARRGENALRR